MCTDLETAKRILISENRTCVLCRGDKVLTDDRRGVKPLLELLESGSDLQGYSAADKVVGKAAACLYRLLGVTEVYAGILSAPARGVLEEGGIRITWGQEVPAIQNRTQTGLCPMEKAVWKLSDPAQAPAVLRAALAALQ